MGKLKTLTITNIYKVGSLLIQTSESAKQTNKYNEMDRNRMNGMGWDGMIWDRIVLLLLTTTANCHHDWLTDWLTMLVPFVFTWPTTTATTEMTTITMSDDKGGDAGDAKRLLTFTTNRWVDGSMWGFCWSYRCNFPELLRNDNMMAKVTTPRPVTSRLGSTWVF